MTELSPIEKKHRREVSYDMDLMNRARDTYGLPDASEAEVLDAIHANYQGGISQYWLNESF